VADEGVSVFPGRVRQLGFIVPDLEAAMAQWTNLGVAPWFVIRETRMVDCRYRGELAEPVISIAVANSGDLQIELIQQHDDTRSIYTEFMEATGGGFHQIAYWVRDVDAVRDAATAAGWTEVWCGDPGAKFSYLEHPDSPVTVVELTEDNELTHSLNEAVRAAAETWKPGEPLVQTVEMP
jgi:Glyoxalase/Bleomycin resistance protein/Dioxygenase superfamily